MALCYQLLLPFDNTDNNIGIMPDLPKIFADLSDWRGKLQVNLTACLKMLMETKHLYQSVTPDLAISSQQEVLTAWKLEATSKEWAVHDNASESSSGERGYYLTLQVRDVKLYCHECKRVEAFNSISSQEFTGRGEQQRDIKSPSGAIQVFVFSFQCQSCKLVPDVFTVRRQGLKLTLCGRAPMEVAEVPAAIPKTIQQYYSGALVAHQSGQTLAGLFLLRTLIEQWARSQVKKPTPPRADDLIDKYMATLPKDFKSRFTSMRSLYDDISGDLHNAIGSI
jgi:hypothetical protein